MDFYYSKKDLLEDLYNPKFNYYINDEKEGLINQEIIDGFDYFYENNKVKIKVAFDENEKFSGIYREFFSNGDIKEEKYYFQGKEIKEEKI